MERTKETPKFEFNFEIPENDEEEQIDEYEFDDSPLSISDKRSPRSFMLENGITGKKFGNFLGNSPSQCKIFVFRIWEFAKNG